MDQARKQFLHVGCGEPAPQFLPVMFRDGTWNEVRLDINPAVEPDIVGSITDMSMISSGRFDAVYSSHNIEHLYAHEVALAVKEFARVLSPRGFLFITCPDLQSVAAKVAEGGIGEPVYDSPAGPITPLDIIFGFQKELLAGNHWMAHKTGFTQRSLAEHLSKNGFAKATVVRRAKSFALVGVAYRESHPKVRDIEDLAESVPIMPAI